jgi:hypothetical protein
VGQAAEQSTFFLDWAAQYDAGDLPGRSRARHEAWINQLSCPVLRLEGDMPLEERVERVQKSVFKLGTPLT